MDRPLTNDFSWSKSRHEKLSECLRSYYLHYYRSWGGWEETAPDDVRRLYILKKLSNRYTWAGSVVHDTVKQALMTIRAGRPVRPEFAIARAHQLMRNDFRHSMNKEYWREKARKQFFGLVEHEYSEPVAAEEWKRNWEAAKQALTWFFASPWIERASALAPQQWLEVDENDFDKTTFQLDGVKVFAIPDFAYVDADGTPVVVDWKTGAKRGGYDAQVLGYALYLSSRYGFPLESIKASLVYLNEGVEEEVRVDPAAVDGFRAHFRQSVSKMRELLLDGAGNSARDESAFPMTDDLTACARCTFRQVCGRGEAAAVRASA
jgi:hypothetical protein